MYCLLNFLSILGKNSVSCPTWFLGSSMISSGSPWEERKLLSSPWLYLYWAQSTNFHQKSAELSCMLCMRGEQRQEDAGVSNLCLSQPCDSLSGQIGSRLCRGWKEENRGWKWRWCQTGICSLWQPCWHPAHDSTPQTDLKLSVWCWGKHFGCERLIPARWQISLF